MDISDVIRAIALLLSYFGVVIIAYGGTKAIWQLISRRFAKGKHLTYARVRGEFAQQIVLGLDFFIASDIITTLSVPTLDEVLRLGGIVVIRSVLTFLLSKETAELRKEEMVPDA